MPSLRAIVGFFVGLFLLLNPARATWSIVIVDLATGEVAIAIATCLPGFDLQPNTVVIVPGYGAAAAQGLVGGLSLRQAIRAGLLNGTQVSQILAQLAAADPSHQSRQYGIVALAGGSTSFTGTACGAFAHGITGQIGTLRYAIQGNVLTGLPVLQAAEAAIQSVPGTIGDKLMAAMQAARLLGGDGRCSCSQAAPTSCGVPPPSFAKAAHQALMIVSRPTDVDAACSASAGCGAGQYWLDLNIALQPTTAVDPVLQLQTAYDAWKLQQLGRPDHYTSTVTLSSPTLRADGVDTVTGTIVLRDAAGATLGNSLSVAVGLAASSTASGITFGPVTPQPNGSYTFTMRGNLDTGDAVLDVAAFDALGRVGIAPRPVVHVQDAFGPCGIGAIGDGAGGVFDALHVVGGATADRVATVGYGTPFTIALDPPQGTSPTPPVGAFALWLHLGLPIGGIEVPLGPTQGSLCFLPAPFSTAPTLLLADSLGLGSLVPATDAPWSLPFPGVPALIDFTLQGLMFVDSQFTLSATNALLVHVVALPPPTLVSVVPIAPAPGQLVTVNGGGFLPGVETRIGGTPVPCTLLSPTQVQFTMPAGAPCSTTLAVANAGSATVQTSFNPTPTITSLVLLSGPASGGAQFILFGQNLLGAAVTIGGAPITVTAQTATVIAGTTPPGTPGPAQVVVRNPAGCQSTSTYTYL